MLSSSNRRHEQIGVLDEEHLPSSSNTRCQNELVSTSPEARLQRTFHQESSELSPSRAPSQRHDIFQGANAHHKDGGHSQSQGHDESHRRSKDDPVAPSAETRLQRTSRPASLKSSPSQPRSSSVALSAETRWQHARSPISSQASASEPERRGETEETSPETAKKYLNNPPHSSLSKPPGCGDAATLWPRLSPSKNAKQDCQSKWAEERSSHRAPVGHKNYVKTGRRTLSFGVEGSASNKVVEHLACLVLPLDTTAPIFLYQFRALVRCCACVQV